MEVIGELSDKNMAIGLTNEIRANGLEVELQTFSVEKGTVYRIIAPVRSATDSEKVEKARDYFRVRLGLPGAPPEIDPEWEKVQGLSMGVGTKFLLIVSVGIFLTSFDKQLFNNILGLLFFNEPGTAPFQSLMQGEVWRLVTPIFLHFNFMHILFNSMWIKELGKLYENEKGLTHFLIFVLSISIFSNSLQYLASGPSFGGLSGLVYGLLGYLWVKGSVDDEANFRLPKRDVMLMVGWYFLCLTGLIGPIANIAHGAGLALGMIWALFPWKSNHLRLRLKYIFLAVFFSLGTYVIEIVKKNFL